MPITILTTGCTDERATQIAREAADRQAQQNSAMAELNKEVARGTKRLVEADAQARKELANVHRELQAERTRLDTGWNDLEAERKTIASRRRTQSLLVPIAQSAGGVLLVALLLGFCWYVLVGIRHGGDCQVELNELVVHELLSEQGPLMPLDDRSRVLPIAGPEPIPPTS